MTAAELTILAPARLLTTNRARSMHWSYRAANAKSWRVAAKIEALAQRVPRFTRATVCFEVTQARGVLADADGHQPVLKAVLDGLVDACVLPDDDPVHVHTISRLAPVKGERDAVTVRLVGELVAAVTIPHYKGPVA